SENKFSHSEKQTASLSPTEQRRYRERGRDTLSASPYDRPTHPPPRRSGDMTIDDLNSLDAAAAGEILRPALDIPRWIDELVAARPFTSREQLLQAAATAAAPFSRDEIDRALTHHPRIGDRAEGDGAEAELSRSEQSGIDPEDAALQ